MSKILVTGASGFIGSTVTRLLRARGSHVRCLTRTTSRLDRIQDLECETVTGDLRNPDSLRNATRGCDAVIHLAGIANWNLIHSPQMRDIVCGGTRNLLEAAAESGIRRFVYTSSTIALAGSRLPVVHDERSSSPLPDSRHYVYAAAKRDAEKLCRSYSDRMHVVIVNPGEVYGPDDTEFVTSGNLIDFGKSNPVLVCNGGTSVCHVEDVAAGIIAALDRGRNAERYILAGENLTIHRLAQLTNEILALKKKILVFPTPLVQGLAWMGRTFHLPLPFSPQVIPYATRYWFTDNSKAVKELGVQFRDARSSLQPALDWCVRAGHIRSKTS